MQILWPLWRVDRALIREFNLFVAASVPDRHCGSTATEIPATCEWVSLTFRSFQTDAHDACLTGHTNPFNRAQKTGMQPQQTGSGFGNSFNGSGQSQQQQSSSQPFFQL